MSPIFTYLLQSSICLGALYVFYHVLLRELPSFVWNRFYLLAMYAISLLLPLLSFDVYPVYIENTFREISTPVSETIAADNIGKSGSSIDWMLGIYFLIVIAFLGRLIFNLWITISQIRKSNKSSQKNYILVEGESEDKVFSFFKYLIKPIDTVLHPDVIEHELTHIRQHHSIDLIVSEIVKAIFWFNPFVYIIQKSIKINHEYICDNEASKINGRYKYAQLLSDISFKQSKLIHVNNFSFKLKNRIIMLQKIDTLTERKWRYALLLPLLVFGLHMYAFDTYNVTIQQSENQVAVIDTVPYQIDTITVFDIETFEQTVTYEKYVVDTLTIFDADTYKETVKVERRVLEEGIINDETLDYKNKTIKQCYVLMWNQKALMQSNKWTVDEIKNALEGEVNLANIIHDSCSGRVESWSARCIVVPEEKDPQLQIINSGDPKISDKLFNDGYLVAGTKLFIHDVTVNGNKEEVLSSVIIIE